MDEPETKRKPKTTRTIEEPLGKLSPLLATIAELVSLLTWTHPAGHRAPILLLLIHGALSLLIRPLTGFDLLLLALASTALLALKHHRLQRLIPPHQRLLECLNHANRLALRFLHLTLYLSDTCHSLNGFLNTHPRSSLLSFFFLLYLTPVFVFPNLPVPPSLFLQSLLFSWNSPPLRWLRKLVSSSSYLDRSYGSHDDLDGSKAENGTIKSRYSYSNATIEEQQQAHLQEQAQKQKQEHEFTTSSSMTPTTTSPSEITTTRPEKRMMIIRMQLTIIENQRWDQDHGWSSELTTEDTSVIGGQWTDMYGQAVSKPNDIKLPPSRPLKTSEMRMMMLEQDRCSTIDGQGSWRWDDLEWTVVRSDHHHPAQDYQPDPLIPSFLQVAFGLHLPSAHPAWSVDPHGWTYGDHSWSKFSKSPRFNSFVRKRKWTRFVSYTAPFCF